MLSGLFVAPPCSFGWVWWAEEFTLWPGAILSLVGSHLWKPYICPSKFHPIFAVWICLAVFTLHWTAGPLDLSKILFFYGNLTGFYYLHPPCTIWLCCRWAMLLQQRPTQVIWLFESMRMRIELDLKDGCNMLQCTVLLFLFDIFGLRLISWCYFDIFW